MVGYEAYEVSDHGRVRRTFGSAQYKAFGVLSPPPDRYGYVRANLKGPDGRLHRVSFHTAVLEAFVGPRPTGHDASHLNGRRTDNRLENLCWETAAENNRRKLEHGTLVHGEAHKCAKLKSEQVADIKKRVADGEKKISLARHYGVSNTLICNIVKGKAWPHHAAA